MSSVSRTESVHNEYIVINEVCKLLSKAFAVLCLFSTTETGVLKNYDLAVVHLGNCLLSVLAYYCIVLSENYLCIYKLCQSVCCCLKRELVLGTVLRLA